MKDFLLKTLNRLYALTGYNQTKDMDPQTKAQLVQELLSESNRFNLPDHLKEKIILLGLRNTHSEAKSFRGISVSHINFWMKQYLEQNPGTGRQPPISEPEQKMHDEIERKAKEELAEKKRENPNYDARQAFFDEFRNIGKAGRQVKNKPTPGNAEDINYEEVQN